MHLAIKAPNASQDLLEAARDRIRKSSSLIIRGISCGYDQGMLVLRGRVPNEFCKRLAKETVADIPGIAQVVNAIEIVPPPRSRYGNWKRVPRSG